MYCITDYFLFTDEYDKRVPKQPGSRIMKNKLPLLGGSSFQNNAVTIWMKKIMYVSGNVFNINNEILWTLRLLPNGH